MLRIVAVLALLFAFDASVAIAQAPWTLVPT